MAEVDSLVEVTDMLCEAQFDLGRCSAYPPVSHYRVTRPKRREFRPLVLRASRVGPPPTCEAR
jgi:hypothetical protein